MNATSLIKRHIFRLPCGRIFTTREMLVYGTRSAVDQALSTLVRQAVIVRLARGVFVRDGSDLGRISIYDIARAKAESFGRRLAAWPGDAATRLGFTAPSAQGPVFAIDSSSSSFRCRDVTVHLRKTCPRKLSMAATDTLQLLNALWHMGRTGLRACQEKLPWLGRTQKEEIRLSVGLLPAWLAAPFLHWRLPRAALYC